MLTKVLINEPRRDPLDGVIEAVELPDGWRRVYCGAVKPGDLYLSCQLFVQDRLILWVEMTAEDLAECFWVYRHAESYLCLIRRGEPVDQECERCGTDRRKFGHRFCRMCCPIVVKEASARMS